MMSDDPLFIARDGEVWACWLNGQPSVCLGSVRNFLLSSEKLRIELGEPGPADRAAPPPPPAPPPPQPQARILSPPPSSVPSLAESRPVVRQFEPRSGHEAYTPCKTTVERSEKRHDVTILGRVYGTDGSRAVTIYDLSSHGCRVEDHFFSKPGSQVTVKIGTVGPLRATIRWRRDNCIGLEFENPLYPSVLDHIRAEHSLR